MTRLNQQQIRQNAVAVFPVAKDVELGYMRLLQTVGTDFIIRTLDRQVYSERERYTFKKDVDAALLSSPIIEATTREIQNSCEGDAPNYVPVYLNLLHQDFSKLMSLTTEFCIWFDQFRQNRAAFYQFLKEYIVAADVDNAHAMYLSSDNWQFSVFKKVIDALQEKYPNRQLFYSILKGGIIDIRTYIYCVANDHVTAGSLTRHVEKTIQQGNIIDQQLWSPLLLFPFVNFHRKTELNQFDLPQFENCPLVEGYFDLYHTRYLYDAIEYFGYYGFVRNAIAELCIELAEKHGDEKLERIGQFITLYQFNFCNEILITT